MESPSSAARRRAWINSSRQWLAPEELDSEGLPCNLPSVCTADDDVFSDGCITGKTENWLLGCGSDAHPGLLNFESVLRAKHADDELCLGADASILMGGAGVQLTTCDFPLICPQPLSELSCLAQCPTSRRFHSTPSCSTPRQTVRLPSLNLGHSLASSCLSSSTSSSSVSEVLHLCAEDAEETLYELGFGCDEPQVTVRIPPRFFTFPSMAQGINFRVFLDSQIRRIREEDPSLSLASRFRQVQVLTAMANAFYSLYSHVSRTPLQKLATPEFSFSSSPMERIERFRSSIRSEPRSPVERLKDTVSKMCLYTGSPRGSDSTSPQPSPIKKSSLPDVVDIVLDKVKTGLNKKLDLGECKKSNEDARLVMDAAESCESREKMQTQQTVVDSSSLYNENKSCHKEMYCFKKDNVDGDENGMEAVGLDSRSHSARTSVASSLSGETVIEADHQFLLKQSELDSCSTQSDSKTAPLKPITKDLSDFICLQIDEGAHQPSCSHHPQTNTSSLICPETGHIDKSCPPSHSHTAVSEPSEDSRSHAPGSFLVQASDSIFAQCCITVTGWEEDSASSGALNSPDSSHTSTVPPVKSCEESFNQGKSQYLKPLTHRGLRPVSSNLKQVNSFELEEVHSAGEEDFGQSETTRTTSREYRGEVVRNDSMHSDSSGYADDEISPSQR